MGYRILKRWIIDYVNYDTFDSLLLLRKNLRRLSYKVSNFINPVSIHRNELEEAFFQLGVKQGDNIFFQSSLSKFGNIDGGPKAIIDILLSSIGDSGLLAMPSFPTIGGTSHYLRRNLVFDVRATPSQMGKITETFRVMDNVYRSVHPTHSLCAFGSGAEKFVTGHEYSPTPFGESSPFAKMIDMDFKQIWFGTGIGVFTLAHLFEDYVTLSFPINTYLHEKCAVSCISQNGRGIQVTTPVHDEVVYKRFIYSNRKKQKQIYERFLASGSLRKCKLGKSEILLISVRDMMDELSHLLKEGYTVYESEE